MLIIAIVNRNSYYYYYSFFPFCQIISLSTHPSTYLFILHSFHSLGHAEALVTKRSPCIFSQLQIRDDFAGKEQNYSGKACVNNKGTLI